MTIYHLGADNLWDIWEPSVLEHSLDVLPLLRKTCSSKFLCFLVFVLQFGQSQSHASDVSNVRTVSSYLALERIPGLVELGKDNCSAYKDLMEREELTRVNQKARYSSQQGLQAVQDLNVLCSESLFLCNTLLRVLRQGIGSSVSLTLTIIDPEVVAREFLGRADLSGAQTLRLHEPTQVVVVGEYNHFVLKLF